MLLALIRPPTSAAMTSAAMTSRTLKLLILALTYTVSLSVLPGSSADAGNKVKHRHAGMHAGMARTVVARSTVQYCRGANLFHCGPIYNSNDYLGDDPDPFIRLMIQRDLGLKYGGEN
jgi:hypothetical protein